MPRTGSETGRHRMRTYPHRIGQMRGIAADFGSLAAQIAERVLAYPGFGTCSGSSKPEQHHYGTGGLQQHTWEVVTLCLDNERIADFNMKKDVSRLELFFAALFHDVGKVHDYELVDGPMHYEPKIWVGTEHRRNIHHISRSAIIWSKAVAETGLFKEMEDNVLHAILAHHGLREYGSPVAPNTKVAWLLHLCDSISARMDDVDKMDIANYKPKQ